MKLLEKQEPRTTYNVNISRKELLVLLAIGGAVGGHPSGPRGVHEGLMRDIREALGIGMVYYEEAANELGVCVKGSIHIDRPPKCPS